MRPTASLVDPLMLAFSDRRSSEWLARVSVRDWRPAGDAGTRGAPGRIENGVPYLRIVASGPPQLRPLAQLQRVDWASGPARAATLAFAGTSVSGVTALELVVCPATPTPPEPGLCLAPARGVIELQARSGALHSLGLERWGLWDVVKNCLADPIFQDHHGRVPVHDCPEGASTVTVASGEAPADLAARFAQRQAQLRADAERKAREARELQVRKAAQERRRAEATLRDARRGTQLFCSSVEGVRGSEPATATTYRCDLTGAAHAFELRELLGMQWDIASESRTPRSDVMGQGLLSVALRLRKM